MLSELLTLLCMGFSDSSGWPFSVLPHSTPSQALPNPMDVASELVPEW